MLKEINCNIDRRQEDGINTKRNPVIWLRDLRLRETAEAFETAYEKAGVSQARGQQDVHLQNCPLSQHCVVNIYFFEFGGTLWRFLLVPGKIDLPYI